MKNQNDYSKIVKSDHLIYLDTIDNEKYYLFKPYFLRVYPKSGSMYGEKFNIKRYLRFLLMSFAGCRIYISTTIDDVVKGSIAYSRGGGFRFPFCTKNDLVDGPSYTSPIFRGQGVSARIGDIAMNVFEKDYDVIYGTIAKDNIASLRRVEKNGFKTIGFVTYNRWHRAVIDPDGDMVLVAYNK